MNSFVFFFFFQAEDGIRDDLVTGVQTCALPILAAVMELALRNPTMPLHRASAARFLRSVRNGDTSRALSRRQPIPCLAMLPRTAQLPIPTLPCTHSFRAGRSTASLQLEMRWTFHPLHNQTYRMEAPLAEPHASPLLQAPPPAVRGRMRGRTCSARGQPG